MVVIEVCGGCEMVVRCVENVGWWEVCGERGMVVRCVEDVGGWEV